MIKKIIIEYIIIEYIILSFITYIFLTHLNLKFKLNNKDVELTELQKKLVTIIISMFWIYYIPKIYFDTKKGEN